MMMLRNILLFLACVCTYGQNTECNICIIDYTCDDDTISFNLSVSKYCEQPINIYYSYDTEIHSGKRYTNTTIPCDGCYFEVDVAVERDAWDYTLIIESPKSSDVCSVRTAQCGGDDSLLLWYITGGLSGLFAILGVASCIARCYNKNRQQKVPSRKASRRKITDREINAAVINA
jgi:hypothetical protein